MPPKRSSTSRGNAVAKRGRGNPRRQGRGGKTHTRVLSDITEESASQVQGQTEGPIKQPAPQKRTAGGPKKRTFEDVAAQDTETSTPGKRETRSQATKRTKQHHEVAGNLVKAPSEVRQGIDQSEATYKSAYDHMPAPDSGIVPTSPAYAPSQNLLFFIHISSLDTDADTESIALDLIKLTLAETNWHAGLSGMVQPVACFLIASLLTRRQNLVEDIAASVEIFDLGYEELVEGYRLLWEWRDNMVAVLGAYADRLAELPEPTLLLASGDYEGNEANAYAAEEGLDERPEPERWSDAVGV